MQSQVKFNTVAEKVSGEGLGGFRAESGQVQQGSGEGSGEGLGSFGAEPGQVQQRSGEGSGEGSEKVPRRSGKLWCRARSGSEQVWEALVERQVRFNRVPEKVAEKVPGSLGAKPSQVQRCQVLEKAGRLGCRAVSEKVPEKVWEGLVQRQVRFNRVPEKEVSEKVPGGFVQRQVRFKGSGEGLGGFGGG